MAAQVIAAPVSELVFDSSNDSSEASSSDEVVYLARLRALVTNDSHVVPDSEYSPSSRIGAFSRPRYESNVDPISYKPRKPTPARSNSFRHFSAITSSLNLPPTASSSQIARATSLAQGRMSGDPDTSFIQGSAYLRISPRQSSSYGSLPTSTFPSLRRSISMTSPPSSARPRKLLKPRPCLPPVPPKSNSSQTSFKFIPSFSFKSDPVPPILSTSEDISSAPFFTKSLPSSPVDLNAGGALRCDYEASNRTLDQKSDLQPSPQKRTANVMRRWSVLEIPDDVLGAELEEARRVNKRKRTIRAKTEHHYTPTREEIALSGAFVYGGPSSSERLFWLGDGEEQQNGSDVEDSDLSDYHSDQLHELRMEGDEVEEEEWKKARGALFCCRELVRTEKNYFARLVQLSNGKTLTAPPVLLMSYLPCLMKASRTLLENFALDPTAYGVSKAFVDAEPTLESALVAYCGVVGAIFTDKRVKRKFMRSSRRNSLIDRSSKSTFLGGTGEITPDSPCNIEEHSFVEKPMLNGCRKSISMGFGRQGNLTNHDQVHPGDKVEKGVKSRYAGTITRTKSLFKKKGMPPIERHRSHSEGLSRPPTPTFAYRAARTISLINLFGLTLTSSSPPPPPKASPPPVPPKDVRPHTRSDPLPPKKMEPEKRSFPARPASSIGYSRSTSTHGFAAASSSSHDGRSEKIPTVRDLAILPTQRVMRFVLLYKDLLEHTPKDSPTRPLVQRAFEAAVRIADKCDRAQGNAAFLRMERS